MLGAPRFTPICTLRGEIGSSDMESRDQTIKLKFMKHLLTSENKLLKEIAQKDITSKTTKFSKITQKYMDQLNINKNQLMNKTDQQIKDVVNKKDTERWRTEKNSKTTLELYNKFKNNIKNESNLYDNSEESIILFKAKTNTLPLYWRNRYQQNINDIELLCPLCKRNIETLHHFLLECAELMNIRQKYNFCQSENQDKILENTLCFNEQIEGKALLKEMWTKRKRKIEDAA